ncbi:integral peroxisomal membrane peroxin-domain-containing protein [Fimicolochytrium jonesii]|uniref:integral peroxisomal membrane peroxin-domain-containing protein n=1 Tax=Fimicolochytrium jonesii TaxID=1396493 RepID=UPI0022FDFFF5|nr:integral peroxisomal membrane peroxin-domain-containing protein [Fimicolochytrium jonesii]KAI8824067.1 integral peroxisomal membrane peroxin-domain-containing protein [Fimicolochytrium jonesii]
MHNTIAAMASGGVHHFEVTTYNKPTYCDACDKFLWGLVRQGAQCKGCGFNVHRKCQHTVNVPCSGQYAPRDYSDRTPTTGEFTSDLQLYDRSLSDTDSRGAMLPLRRKSESHVIIPGSKAVTAPKKPLTKRTRSGNASDSGQEKEKEMSFVQELMTHTAVNSAAMQRAAKEPSLNLLTTTPKNFTRFVSRLGPMVGFQDDITEILTWQNPSKTFIIMVVYVFLCIYPTLFIVLPQLLLIYNIMNNYYTKTKKTVTGKKPSANVQYLKNMQFIQNSMGMYCDAYEDVKKNSTVLDWSDEEETIRILKVAVGSMFGVIFVVRIIPFNYIMLLGGVGMFLQNTAIFRAASTTVPPVLMKKLQHQVDTVREAIREARKGADDGVVVVSLYENQRWWAGLGWIPHLLRSERPAWSDETGTISRPAKDHYEPPQDGGVWEWMDEDWLLDVGWANVDEKGWQYMDHTWENAKSKASMGSLTRRRMWVRKMRLVKEQQAAIEPPSVVKAIKGQ